MVIGNLETPFAEDAAKAYGFKSAYIKSNPRNLELLKYLHIDVVNLANNHIYDFGKPSYELTKKLLRDHGIKYFGIENEELIIESEGNKIALNGFCCYSTNPLGIHSEQKKGINELDVPVVEKKLKENSEKNLFNILSVHCGQEHVNYPNYDHVRLARQLAKIAPYVFYGHHPHVAQGIETMDNSLLAYSLGNFCFDDVYTSKSAEPLIKQTENNKESFILEIEIQDNQLISHTIVPIYLGELEMALGNPAIMDKIKGYSKKLTVDAESYQLNRKKLLDSYISGRKQQRNLNWYMKRLNYKSFFLLLFARRNAKKYFNAVPSHLK